MKKFDFEERFNNGCYFEIQDDICHMPKLQFIQTDSCPGTYGKYYDSEYGFTERMTQEEFDHLINKLIENIERVLGVKVSRKEIDNYSGCDTYFIEFENHACVLDCENYYEEIDNEDYEDEDIPEEFQFGKIEFGFWRE